MQAARGLPLLVLLGLWVLFPRPAAAYSVLAHEVMVDAVWADTIVPLLRSRFPRVSKTELTQARAYAYGGSVIQDLGYYPFGSKLFSNLVHYVRSGDFVESLVRNAQDVNEYAFALGALAHYASDNTGHALAVNRALPMQYPELRAKFGNEVLYTDAPAQHAMIEFAFDVLQIGAGAYAAQAYHDFIGFSVATPLLAKAFEETYCLEFDDLFMNEDLAIGSYRRAISKTIPEMTRLAWEDKADDIRKRNPRADRASIVFAMTRQEYEREFGTSYKKPGILSRILYAVMKLVPKVGPFRPLAFEPLQPDVEQLFLRSFSVSLDNYRIGLRALARQRVQFTNTDLETGKPPVRAFNALVEETYEELLEKLARRRFAGLSPALRANIDAHYASPIDDRKLTRKQRKLEQSARRLLAEMRASGTVPVN